MGRPAVVLTAVWLMLSPAGAGVDETDDIYIDKARKFVADHKMLAAPPATPRELVIAAVRIEGLRNMVLLYRRGVLPAELKTELLNRLDIHAGVGRQLVIHLVIHKDPLVSAPAAHVRTHARVAWFATRDKVHRTPYGYVEDLTAGQGRYRHFRSRDC